MQDRLAEITRSVDSRPKPRLAFIEWIDPPMSGGHWMPELIDVAGGFNLFGSHGAQSRWISIADVEAADPDVILVAPCGYDLAKTREEMAVLDSNPAWQALRAVGDGCVYIADGNAYFNRPGPRLVESAEILAEILHPGLANYGHVGHAVVQHRPVA
jgi:iron complex transport system substrate-binding protein